MSDGAYIAWDELEEEEEAGEPPAPPLPRNERLAALLAERARLERELGRLLGKEPVSEEDKRENARFPMPIHTAQSRMDDRRITIEELRASTARRRALERARLRMLEEQQRADRKHEQERAAVQRELLRIADERRRRELLEQIERERRVSEGIQKRWADQRRAALQVRENARRAEWTLFDERSERFRELAAAVSEARNRERAELHARLDRRAARGRRRRSAGTED
ncbi:hypothetical protein [Sorangium sp. So ce426]|uniref:hypothetical protein n=1 Tax=Sorangium sp. So ce426 TaxID=3133312 RepID=UPI003F5B4804